MRVCTTGRDRANSHQTMSLNMAKKKKKQKKTLAALTQKQYWKLPGTLNDWPGPPQLVPQTAQGAHFIPLVQVLLSTRGNTVISKESAQLRRSSSEVILRVSTPAPWACHHPKKVVTAKEHGKSPGSNLALALISPCLLPASQQSGSCQNTLGEDVTCANFRSRSLTPATGHMQTTEWSPHKRIFLRDQDR